VAVPLGSKLWGEVSLGFPEARKHGRIDIELRCRLAGEVDTVDALVVNLGLGGAMVRATPGLAKVGESIGVEIERPEPDTSMLLMAEVVRVRANGPHAEYGLRFLPGPPSLQEELERFVASLATARGTAPGRIHHRLEVHCAGHDQFKATMVDIFRGGLTLESTVNADPGDTLQVSLSLPGMVDVLVLPGTVASVSPGESSYRVTLGFAALTAEQTLRIEQLLRLLLLLGRASGRDRT
jgi:hypothetical protein